MLHLFAMAGFLHDGRGHGGGSGFAHSAPEIDAGSGVMALALVVSVGLLAYSRYRKK